MTTAPSSRTSAAARARRRRREAPGLVGVAGGRRLQRADERRAAVRDDHATARRAAGARLQRHDPRIGRARGWRPAPAGCRARSWPSCAARRRPARRRSRPRCRRRRSPVDGVSQPARRERLRGAAAGATAGAGSGRSARAAATMRSRRSAERLAVGDGQRERRRRLERILVGAAAGVARGDVLLGERGLVGLERRPARSALMSAATSSGIWGFVLMRRSLRRAARAGARVRRACVISRYRAARPGAPRSRSG